MIGKTNKAYFRVAKAVAELSNYPIHKIGCVVVKGHRIVSSGHNHKTKCCALQAKLDTEKYKVPCPGKYHAEIMALLPLMKAKVDLKGCSIYVYREHKDGTLAMARPCSSCEKVIRQCGIKKIFYSIENGYAVEKW